jgi:putative ABC transport system permease protein
MLVQVATRNIFRNPRRTVKVLLTVSIGVGALFLFEGFNKGIIAKYRHNTIRSRYGNGSVHLKGYREKLVVKPQKDWIDNWKDLRKKLKRIPGVKHVFPRVGFSGLISNGRMTVGGLGEGVDYKEESKFFTSLSVVEGELMTSHDDGILVGVGLAKMLAIKPGDRVTVIASTVFGSSNAVDLFVTGIVRTGVKTFDDKMFRIPLEQALQLLDIDRVESFSLGLESHNKWKSVEEHISSNMSGYSATSFEVLDKLFYQNFVDLLNFEFDVIQIIILAIVVLGIFNAISTSIFERKQEIGNLRANGESKLDVLKMLLGEGLVLGVVGGLTGILISVCLNKLVLSNGIPMPPFPGLTKTFPIVLELDFNMAITTFLLGAVCLLWATIVSGLKVVRIDIAESLRSV